MARKFKSFETRDKPKKRGPRKHKKSLNKNEKRQKRTDVIKAKEKDNLSLIPKSFIFVKKYNNINSLKEKVLSVYKRRLA